MTIAERMILVRAFPWEGLAHAVVVGPGKASQIDMKTNVGNVAFCVPEIHRGQGLFTLPLTALRIERRPGRRRVWVVS